MKKQFNTRHQIRFGEATKPSLEKNIDHLNCVFKEEELCSSRKEQHQRTSSFCDKRASYKKSSELGCDYKRWDGEVHQTARLPTINKLSKPKISFFASLIIPFGADPVRTATICTETGLAKKWGAVS